MLKNVMYTGVLRSGETLSQAFPHLQIITPEIFSRAAQIMSDRTQHKSGTPISTKSVALLSGLLYCAHCGTKIILSASGGYNRATRYRYQCHHRVRHPDECDNQATFTVHILDSIVEKAVLTLFENMGKVSANKVINDRYAKETRLAEARVKKLSAELESLQKEVDAYKAEVGKSLRGDSKWDADLLREQLNETMDDLAKKETELQEAQAALDDCTARMAQIKVQHKEMLSWAKIFARSSTEAKKMILSKLIERIEVGRDYELNICFRISYAQFCGVTETSESNADTAS